MDQKRRRTATASANDAETSEEEHYEVRRQGLRGWLERKFRAISRTSETFDSIICDECKSLDALKRPAMEYARGVLVHADGGLNDYVTLTGEWSRHSTSTRIE